MQAQETEFQTDFAVGPSAIGAYARLSYTMWHALAEFIDNSTQSRKNYDGIVDEALKDEGSPLVVQITYSKLLRTIIIEDNSIGMSREDLINALRIAHPTADSKGRSKYGMGLKTAACWIGKRWVVVTTELTDGMEYTATIDVEAVSRGEKILIKARPIDPGTHYTRIEIGELNRTIQGRTEENIRSYLGSMYRFDLKDDQLKLLYNGDPINPPDELEFDTDAAGAPYKRDLPAKKIGEHHVKGWVGVLKRGGRKYGGFSMFQNKRQIQGFPNAWKPRNIFGGVDEEGANNLISQRLIGVIELDGFDVSHTKDAILFRDGEQEALEEFLEQQTKDYCDYASRRRGTTGKQWNRDKVRDLINGMRDEFSTDEFKDAAQDVLPPLATILENNRKQADSVTTDESVIEVEVVPGLRVVVALQERSENDPYLTITTAAAPGKIFVIINNLHPYYADIDSPDANEECIRQFIYDAIAEYLVSKQTGKVSPESMRKKKDSLLRAKSVRGANLADAVRSGHVDLGDVLSDEP
ncbi:histidine kinase/DNA gyrase B/HSP90-like ATPase [Luteibacter sp. OK325]|uniref:ATP-binding protein n=1 Tax=Luteibacter sp. OK325 TaxID=2135670 RepID=UPI000D3AAAB9|nr:ATP-binding protein [Luteibacter sp. OK325]PTR33648.1 histidine kinase/DNA gyrase B/HSP90-like ATPase [Luteibacter sp. OK325]